MFRWQALLCAGAELLGQDDKQDSRLFIDGDKLPSHVQAAFGEGFEGFIDLLLHSHTRSQFPGSLVLKYTIHGASPH